MPRRRPSPSRRFAGPYLSPRMSGGEDVTVLIDVRHSGAVEAFCTPQKPNSAPATRRIWISSEPSVMR